MQRIFSPIWIYACQASVELFEILVQKKLLPAPGTKPQLQRLLLVTVVAETAVATTDRHLDFGESRCFTHRGYSWIFSLGPCKTDWALGSTGLLRIMDVVSFP